MPAQREPAGDSGRVDDFNSSLERTRQTLDRSRVNRVRTHGSRQARRRGERGSSSRGQVNLTSPFSRLQCQNEGDLAATQLDSSATLGSTSPPCFPSFTDSMMVNVDPEEDFGVSSSGPYERDQNQGESRQWPSTVHETPQVLDVGQASYVIGHSEVTLDWWVYNQQSPWDPLVMQHKGPRKGLDARYLQLRDMIESYQTLP
ncbi:uncharacterized protein B0I36DRAFT_68818 [Microdochium trichocladiopsis]|uniref:Uncharacterized protein n=1 Tax=Microdochium trichocladiopsis TaxID=1682393 RepID=A0A9P8YEP3_9PEZI|nr:uncharacterized protein B0I36DRAFT_68818 [Microdochium trichocladiopsis]KAH7037626.1 hypothetical protein B0I36DRAFT_68818 [Microdochium trichocladiopsis]